MGRIWPTLGRSTPQAHHLLPSPVRSLEPEMSPRMTNPWHLGNDVVDLHHQGGVNKARDGRFLARVCSPDEERVIRASQDPDVALWVHWAGKEAVYKSASKALGSPPVFEHPLFRVAFPEPGLSDFLARRPARPGVSLAGSGTFGGLSFRLLVERGVSSVHAVSWIRYPDREGPAYRSHCQEWGEETRGPSVGLEPHFSAIEWTCVTHRASGLTRIMARKALAEALGVVESSLEIRCGPGSPGRRIPSVWLDGKELPVDLSLSHHGRFLAWTFLAVPGG